MDGRVTAAHRRLVRPFWSWFVLELAITERGQEVLAANPERVDLRVLASS
jgi:hypothetical protein